ncbi:GGDEF domain-containing protein [Exiguobacterium oxidotolerans]|uniref:GGDEF domain-containing protein n=1 Tax=Exiguobacterium oxidotolerans TaxID=223958 RepID=A0A653IHU7_9BACL|nr:GGDEF domain-containing protein [Exiguobacterium oxidotolerans]VWX38349.1 GGDEF domain-containing protein [Exiguobacterium oxidotolerans]
MLSIMNNFIINFCLLFTTITLLFLPFRNQPRVTPNASLATRLILGVVAGAIAVLLMFNSIQIDVARIDLRIIPVVIATFFGGLPSALITGIMIIGTRFLITPIDQIEGAILASVIISLFILTIGITRKFLRMTLASFELMTGIGILYSLPAIYALTNSWGTFFKVSIAYIFFNLLAALVTFRLLTELRRHFENIQYQQRLAMTDALTGLANRRRLDDSLSLVGSDDNGYSLILIDIDFFKHVNDTYGHDSGDDVLRQLGTTLASIVRPDDLVGRYGGEEFLIILPNTSLKDAKKISELARTTVARNLFPTAHVPDLQITISLGIAHSGGSHTSLEALQQADKALYASKEHGRNQSTIYTKQLEFRQA